MGLNTLKAPLFPLTADDINGYFKDKIARLEDFCNNQLNRTMTMFKYNGLPEELREKDIERIRQVMGYGMFTYKNGQTYAFSGSFAPPVNYLHQNTGFIVNNPWIDGFDGCYKLVNLARATKDLDNYSAGEGVLFRNDPLCSGLYPLFIKYGIMSIENDLTLRVAEINLRQFIQMIAKDDNSYESALLWLQKIEAGEQGVIQDGGFGEEEFKGNPITIPTTFMSQLIEGSQYIKASFMNEIGLNANYNMKREKLSEGETEMNLDMLRPLPDVMLEERKEDAEAYADFTGGEVKWSVEFDSVWAKFNRPYSVGVEGNAEIAEISDDSEEVEEYTTEEENVPVSGYLGANLDNVEEQPNEETGAKEVAEVVKDIAEIVENIAEIAEISDDSEEVEEYTTEEEKPQEEANSDEKKEDEEDG